MSNHRLNAAVKAWDHHWGDRYGDEALDEMGEEVAVALEAADKADREQGIHRVKVDYSTVMDLDSILHSPRKADESLGDYADRRMSEVIAALTGEA